MSTTTERPTKQHPVLKRVDVLERVARGAHDDGRIDDDARDLALEYVTVVREVLPLVTGWGSAQAMLDQATEQAIALLVRFMRLPSSRRDVDPHPLGAVPTPTFGGVLTGGLEVLVKYARSVGEEAAEQNGARLLEMKDSIDAAFGAGFRPAYGIGDPAAEPDPEPEDAPAPEPPAWVALLAAALRLVGDVSGLIRHNAGQLVVLVLAVAVLAAGAFLWPPR